MYENKMKIEFLSKSENESFARVSVAAFISQLDPTIDEITDVKTAVISSIVGSNCDIKAATDTLAKLSFSDLLKNSIFILYSYIL